jgi:hypothetical protein
MASLANNYRVKSMINFKTLFLMHIIRNNFFIVNDKHLQQVKSNPICKDNNIYTAKFEASSVFLKYFQ